MMSQVNNARPVAERLGKVNLVLTASTLTLLVVDFVLRRLADLRPAILDSAVFAAFWIYLLAVPVVGVLALALGRKSQRTRKLNYVLLGIWLAFFLATVVISL